MSPTPYFKLIPCPPPLRTMRVGGAPQRPLSTSPRPSVPHTTSQITRMSRMSRMHKASCLAADGVDTQVRDENKISERRRKKRLLIFSSSSSEHRLLNRCELCPWRNALETARPSSTHRTTAFPQTYIYVFPSYMKFESSTPFLLFHTLNLYTHFQLCPRPAKRLCFNYTPLFDRK